MQYIVGIRLKKSGKIVVCRTLEIETGLQAMAPETKKN